MTAPPAVPTLSRPPVLSNPLQVALSWIRNNPTWRVELLSEDNLEGYLGPLPYYRKENTPAARSDILRLTLLAKHGGVWADATFINFIPLDQWVYEAVGHNGFWAYHGHGDWSGPASWHLISVKASSLVTTWHEAIVEEWAARIAQGKHTHENYFWMDAQFRAISDRNTTFAEEWRQVPLISCEAHGEFLE